MLIDTRKSPFAKVSMLPQENVRLLDGFWKERFDTCADVTIPHILEIFDDSESFFHQVENFRIAAGLSQGKFRGTPYGDGDFYKLMEGLAYAYAKRRDPALDAQMDSYIALIAQAQLPDGYLSTKQIIGERTSNGVKRHGDVNDFEEYNFGHLFTSACMHHRITGKDNFLQVALKCASYLENTYKKVLAENRAWTAVCPSHYMGLIELYRETGDPRHLETAKMAIKIRELVENGTDDNQDRIPLREHRKIVGHGVRSTYLYAGVADLYLETGDETLLPVLQSCWDNMVNTKLYINGGCGALYTGTSPFGHLMKAQYVHQAFGYEYQLPNVTAYNETCATLGSIFWALRMFAAEPKGEYMDLIERSTYNLALAAVNLQGNRYFYENMLRRTASLEYLLMWPLTRSDTFHCFCCPTNLSRSLMQVMEYGYSQSADAVWLGVYGASEADFSLENGARFTLRQQTNYPWDGKIDLSVINAGSAQGFCVKVRVPGWVERGSITCAGRTWQLSAKDAHGYIDVPVDNPQGASITIDFDMPARLTQAHKMVEEDTNQICVERGPLVYCIESADVPGGTLDGLMLPSDASFEKAWHEIGGHPVVALTTKALVLDQPSADEDALYRPFRPRGFTQTPVRMIPYYAWDNRGFGEMKIWLPVHYRFA